MSTLNDLTINALLNGIWGDNTEPDESIATRFQLQPGDALIWDGVRLLTVTREPVSLEDIQKLTEQPDILENP